MKLQKEFYLRKNVVQISKDLLGKVLVTNFQNELTSGIIIETEAYAGITDKASHAYNNRRTERTETMFAEGGVAYVYLCYGIHHLFNVVTNVKDIPHAVLIRAVKPLEGIEMMLERRNFVHNKKISHSVRNDNNKLSAGPGTTAQALGIKTAHTGIGLTQNTIWIEDRGIIIPKKNIISTRRIGVDYAGADAKLPYRFLLDKNTIGQL